MVVVFRGQMSIVVQLKFRVEHAIFPTVVDYTPNVTIPQRTPNTAFLVYAA